jgi:metal-responsive CopG/Arc/MetJ family transcriptional regulator
MKLKISLTLSEDLIRELDRMAGPKVPRSSFIERILRYFVEQRARQKRLAQDVAAINQHAEKLNSEMSDALQFQARWSDACAGASCTGYAVRPL